MPDRPVMKDCSILAPSAISWYSSPMPSRKPRTNGTTLVESAAREWRGERADVLATAQAMARSGLVVGTSGNVSLRLAGGVVEREVRGWLTYFHWVLLLVRKASGNG